MFLWFWGSRLAKLTTHGVTTSSLVQYSADLSAITTPIAVLMWAVGVILFLGLPDYYRQTPGQVPSFYGSVMRRKVVLVGCYSLPFFKLSCSKLMFPPSGSSSPSSFKITSYRLLTVGIGSTSGQVNTLPYGPSLFWLSFSLSASGPPFSGSSVVFPYLTPGSCPFLQSVLVLLVGAKCCGVFPAWACMFHGLGHQLLAR